MCIYIYVYIYEMIENKYIYETWEENRLKWLWSNESSQLIFMLFIEALVLRQTNVQSSAFPLFSLDIFVVIYLKKH